MAGADTHTPEATGAGAEPLLGLVKVLPVDRGEVPTLLEGIKAARPSALSPLRALVDLPATGRPWSEIEHLLGAVAPDAMRHFLEPLSAPDRILDARAALYEGAPTPVRLYSSRRHGPGWAGMRPSLARDWELLGPYGDDDLQLWVQLQLELSGGNNLPTPFDRLTGEELAFLLALVDAWKLQLHRSYTARRTAPAQVRFRWSDIVEAQNLALRTRDRRWLLTAIGEILDVLVHPGGSQGVGLPPVTAALAEREVRRYVASGWLTVVERGTDPLLSLDGPLPVLATSLLAWLSTLSFHDVQVTGWDAGRAVACEELLLLIVGEPAIWALASDGLTEATSDVSSVRFGLRSLSIVTALEVVRRFLAPIPGVVLPADVYVGAPRGAATPPWSATHRVPAAGLPAWREPDAGRDAVATLEGGLVVELVEQRADRWAQIVCENGWSAWVDGAQLEEVGS